MCFIVKRLSQDFSGGSARLLQGSRKTSLRRRSGLESSAEVFDDDSRLPNDRSQRPAGELVVKRDDCCPASCVAKLHVTAALTDLLEAQPL